jgi:hypothetical protein
MTEIPDNFPSYTSYNAKMVLLHVDTLKQAVKELQDLVTKLQTDSKRKEPKNGGKEERKPD